MKNMRVLIIANHPAYVYSLRKEIIIELLNQGYHVGICCPYGKELQYFIERGCEFFPNSIDRHGMNIISDLSLKKQFGTIMDEFKPRVLLTYTIKPNIYGAIEARKRSIPQIANITGLGTAMEGNGLLKKFLVCLYRYSFLQLNTIFFQNIDNSETFKKLKIYGDYSDILPGSGVNTNHFSYLDYPNNNVYKFVFISRVMKEKGIDDFLYLAKEIKEVYPNTEFHICGFIEQEYKEILEKLNNDGTIIYHGMVADVRVILKDMHCIIHPSRYPEGISNVLLEAASSGRPIITTDNIGCRDVVSSKYRNGYIIENRDQLLSTVKKFIELTNEEKKEMGVRGRLFVTDKFDRRIVVDKYMNRIEEIINFDTEK